MNSTFDVIVIGAGAVGSGAAYHAAKRGQRVLLLEQFEIDHQMGSSYGHSRIIRYAYDYPQYVELAKAAYPMWLALQDEAGDTLYRQTGGVDFGSKSEHTLLETARSLTVNNIPFEQLSAAEGNERFPQFHFDDDQTVIYQADAGILQASKGVRAHVRLAQQHGAVVRDRNPVTNITIHSDSVDVETANGTFSGARLVMVPGGWGRTAFRMIGLDLPLVPVRSYEAYYDVQPANAYEWQNFPVFIAHITEPYGKMPYGLPSIDGSGLKCGLHGGPPIDDLDKLVREPDPEKIEKTRAFMRRHIPAGADAPLKVARVCLYTMTPDEHFTIDKHPEHDHVVISASCSGHAYKFSTLIGSILTDLAFDGSTQHDISLFKVDRLLDLAPNTDPNLTNLSSPA